jgi:hypothetical protein
MPRELPVMSQTWEPVPGAVMIVPFAGGRMTLLAVDSRQNGVNSRSLKPSAPGMRSATLGEMALVLSFPPFRLDMAEQQLWRDGTE